MSTSKSSATIECKHPKCNEFGNHWEFQSGYCSNRCRIRHKGLKQLSKFKYDHTRCFSCFQTLKTVNPPKPDFEFTEKGHGWTLNENEEPTLEFYSQKITRQAATGFQFLTKFARKGEKQRDDRVITGTICDHCGNTDHTHHIPMLADRTAIDRLVNLLNDEDSVVFDDEMLHREYEKTSDLELAVGRALKDT